MPIQVYIEVNGRNVETVHIGRVKGEATRDSVNVYSAVVKYGFVGTLNSGRKYTADTPSNQEWDAGVKFEHRYGDGIEVCVQKALEALNRPD